MTPITETAAAAIPSIQRRRLGDGMVRRVRALEIKDPYTGWFRLTQDRENRRKRIPRSQDFPPRCQGPLRQTREATATVISSCVSGGRSEWLAATFAVRAATN
jgi:hypothetical protein